MSEFLKDPMFFYAIAFVIFACLAYIYGREPALQMLDSEILKIRNELEQARALRREAEATLADYTAKHADALKQAEAIVKHAAEEAARLKAQAEIDLKNALARHEQQAADRIRLAEAAAIADVRSAAIDLATDMARNTIAKSGDASIAKILDKAIAELPRAPAVKAA